MRLLRLSEIHPDPEDRVFRYSPALVVAWALGIFCVASAMVLVEWEGRTRSAYYLAYYISGVLLLGLLLMSRFLLARLRPSNWLVRMRADGLLIQFRSYLNYHLPAGDPTVVFIPYEFIRSARLLRERTKIPDHNGASMQTRRLVELELAGDLTPLSKALAMESARPAPQEKTWYGKTSTLYGHYPVRMVSAQFLQVEWPVAPPAAKLLDALRPYTAIVPPVDLAEDFANLGNLSREEQGKRLLELDRGGRTIAAIYVARRLYGYDLNQAQAYVEGLRKAV